MNFEDLKFTPQGDEAPDEWARDAMRVQAYLESFLASIGIKEAKIPLTPVFNAICIADRVLGNHIRIKSPSVFKRASAYCIGFMMESPVDEPFGPNLFGERIGHIANHQNAMIAFEVARWSLHGATVIKVSSSGTGGLVEEKLEAPITVSKHYYADLIAAFASIPVCRNPAYIAAPGTFPYFHFLALLFESLAYQANPGASEDRVV